MLEMLLKLYTAYMRFDVRSPVPHLVGPPGCGKSTVVQLLGEMVGRKVHTLNVSRLSPLEVEGVQMPVSEKDAAMRLQMLHATYWTQLRDGDVLLLDEFLRGFPEVYNGLLDILTSREVAGMSLPKVFIIAASNSVTSYDKALEDRLLHLPVPDPRHSRKEKNHLAKLLVDQLGLHPNMVKSMEMQQLLDQEVLPMYDLLDSFKGAGATAPSAMLKGRSIRNLIGQAQLRQINSTPLRELLDENNRVAMREGKTQYVFIADPKQVLALSNYEEKAEKLVGNDRLSPLQAANLDMNLQLIEMEKIRNEKGTTADDDTPDPDLDDIFG